jgi:uncharacterized damage-inducible protein DinB
MAKPVPFVLHQALLNAFETNERINQNLLENIPAPAWHTTPSGKGRTIVAIVAHIHNVRVRWLKAAAKESGIPEQLDRNSTTPSQAAKSLTQSYAALNAVIQSAVEGDDRVQASSPTRQDLSDTSSATTLTIAARFPCWPGRPAIQFPRRRCWECGTGVRAPNRKTFRAHA